MRRMKTAIGVEKSSGQFVRRFRLPENVKMDQVKASMENRVLTVTIPKEDEKKPEILTRAWALALRFGNVGQSCEHVLWFNGSILGSALASTRSSSSRISAATKTSGVP
ncbi:hypothetical protein LguiB_031541 [Lonicera macranthoides]